MSFHSDNRLSFTIKNVFYKSRVQNSYNEKSRGSNGLIFYAQGGHSFQFVSKKLIANENQLVYLPMGSEYTNQLLKKDTEYYQIDFVCYANGNPVQLFDGPFVLSEEIALSCLPTIKKLLLCFSSFKQSSELLSLGYLCNLLGKIKEGATTPAVGLPLCVQKCISYIEKNYMNEITVQDLANFSFMSVSNVEKNFKKHLNTTPIHYRNLCRLRQARLLLSSGYNVTETSFKVGFSDVYYFSKLFKAYMGISPSRYKKDTDSI